MSIINTMHSLYEFSNMCFPTFRLSYLVFDFSYKTTVQNNFSPQGLCEGGRGVRFYVISWRSFFIFHIKE